MLDTVSCILCYFFPFTSSDDTSFGHGFVRLERMLQNHDDPNDISKV